MELFSTSLLHACDNFIELFFNTLFCNYSAKISLILNRKNKNSFLFLCFFKEILILIFGVLHVDERAVVRGMGGRYGNKVRCTLCSKLALSRVVNAVYL